MRTPWAATMGGSAPVSTQIRPESQGSLKGSGHFLRLGFPGFRLVPQGRANLRGRPDLLELTSCAKPCIEKKERIRLLVNEKSKRDEMTDAKGWRNQNTSCDLPSGGLEGPFSSDGVFLSGNALFESDRRC